VPSGYGITHCIVLHAVCVCVSGRRTTARHPGSVTMTTPQLLQSPADHVVCRPLLMPFLRDFDSNNETRFVKSSRVNNWF